MSLFYWVGGSSTWTSSSTANWATSSGGVGGAGPVTSTDDAIFDTLSNATAYTVTIGTGAVCHSVTFAAPLSGNITVAGSAAFSVYGSFAFPTSGITRTYTGIITFKSTTTGNTITGGATSITAGQVVLDGVGGEWTLSSNLSCGTLVLNNGSFITNNKNVTVTNLTCINAVGSSLTLGSSTVNISSASNQNLFPSTGLTLSSGTSTLNFSSTSSILVAFGGLSLYNVTFVSNATANSVKLITVADSLGIPCSGTLTVGGTSLTSRASIIGGLNQGGNPSTNMPVSAATMTCSYCDFRNVTFTGAAAPFSSTGLGDCGGNSGITFSAPKTVYWNLGGTVSWTATGWATSSGGTPNSANFPLAQDTAIFDNTGTAATVNGVNSFSIGNLNFSARTSAMTFGGGSLFCNGNITLGTGVSGGSFTANSTSSQSITCNGSTGLTGLTVWSNSFSFSDTFSCTGTLNLSGGTINSPTNPVTCGSFSCGSGSPAVLNMGNVTWTMSSTGTVWSCLPSLPITINPGSSTILLSDTSTTARSFQTGGYTYNNLTIGGSTGISTLTMFGSGTFSQISSTKTVAHTISFTGLTTTTVASWTVNGTSGNVVTIGSADTNNWNLVKTGGGTVTANYMSISRSQATPSSTWYATNSTDGGNNSGWTFGAPPPPGGTANFLMLF